MLRSVASAQRMLDCLNLVSDSQSYYEVLGYFQNAIPDNHIQIYPNIHLKKVAGSKHIYTLPFKLFINQNAICIEDVSDSTYKNLKGGKIISVNDTAILSFRKYRSTLISYSNSKSGNWKLERSLFETLRPETYKLQVQSANGTIQVVSITSSERFDFMQKGKWMYYVDDEKTKLYIDLNSLSFSTKEALVEIVANKNINKIIFDALEYPSTNVLDLIAHFTDKPLASPIFISSFTSNPFGVIVHKQAEESWTQEVALPRINIPCVFLVRGTYSWGETFLDMIKTNHIGKLVGEETGGTNGNIVFVRTPLFDFTYTQMKTINRSNHLPANETTIAPDVRFEKTENNFLTYRDDLIKFALTVPSD